MPEPAPIPNDSPSMHDLVIQDLQARKAFGLEKYGTVLQAHNGRRPYQDLIEELLDAICYAKQAQIEMMDMAAFIQRQYLWEEFEDWRAHREDC